MLLHHHSGYYIADRKQRAREEAGRSLETIVKFLRDGGLGEIEVVEMVISGGISDILENSTDCL